MNSQQEYEKFLAKFLKTVQDVRRDFDELSPENQQRFLQEANKFLKGYGYAITVEDLVHTCYRWGGSL